MIEKQGTESELGAYQRNHFQLREQAIRVRKRNTVRRLLAVYGDVSQFHLQMERNHVEATDLSPSSGDALNFRDNAAAHISLEGTCGGVPESGKQGDDSNAAQYQQYFQPAARSGGGFAHRVCTPSPRDSAATARLTLLSERSDCSHETINSFTFSSVSSS